MSIHWSRGWVNRGLCVAKRILQMWLRIQLWNEEIILGYLGGPNLVTEILKSREPFPSGLEIRDQRRKKDLKHEGLTPPLVALRMVEGGHILGNVDVSRKWCSVYDQQENKTSVLQPQDTNSANHPKEWGHGSSPPASRKESALLPTPGLLGGWMSSHGESMLIHSKPRTPLWLSGGLLGGGWWHSVLSFPGSKLAASSGLSFSPKYLLFPKLLLPLFLPQASPSLFPGSSQVLVLKTPGTLFSTHLRTNKFQEHFSRVGAPLSFRASGTLAPFSSTPRGETLLLPQLYSLGPTPA